MASDDWPNFMKGVLDATLEREGKPIFSLPRQAGKSRLDAMMKDFLNTPGYSTDEAAKYGSHEAYMSAVFKKEAAKVPEDIEDLNSFPDAEELDYSPEVLSELLTQHVAMMGGKYMLTEPMMLTVKMNGGKYSKIAHIGGEEFRPTRVYPGKRNSLIHVFLPVGAAPYEEMEMTEADAFKHFADYAKMIEPAIEGGYSNVKIAKRRSDAVKAEREKLASREEVYKDLGFASW